MAGCPGRMHASRGVRHISMTFMTRAGTKAARPPCTASGEIARISRSAFQVEGPFSRAFAGAVPAEIEKPGKFVLQQQQAARIVGQQVLQFFHRDIVDNEAWRFLWLSLRALFVF
jgi:hypothetical protein